MKKKVHETAMSQLSQLAYTCKSLYLVFVYKYCGLVDAKIRPSDKDLPVYQKPLLKFKGYSWCAKIFQVRHYFMNKIGLNFSPTFFQTKLLREGNRFMKKILTRNNLTLGKQKVLPDKCSLL